jgi:hypothetical protein
MDNNTKEFKAQSQNQGEVLKQYIRNSRVIMASQFLAIVVLIIYIALKQL